MAHSCPHCCSACYCGGDIDDCLLDDEEDVIFCTHCDDCEDREDDFEESEIGY